MVLEKIVALYLATSLGGTPISAMSSPKEDVMNVNPNIIQERIEPNQHYAREVIYEETKGVEFAHNALGRPDAKTDPGAAYAVIQPGGELTLKMDKPFAFYTFYDSGRIIAKKGAKCSVVAFVPTEDTYAWREVLPGVVPGGIQIHQSAGVKVDIIKIKNIGNEPAYLDAVVGYGYDNK